MRLSYSYTKKGSGRMHRDGRIYRLSRLAGKPYRMMYWRDYFNTMLGRV